MSCEVDFDRMAHSDLSHLVSTGAVIAQYEPVATCSEVVASAVEPTISAAGVVE